MLQQIYKHSCSRCQYIGRINHMDAYYCQNETTGDISYLLRYGNGSGDFTYTADAESRIYNRVRVENVGLALTAGSEVSLRRLVLLEMLRRKIAQSMNR